MSPLSLRRYRADRLLREEFQALRTRVLAGVRCRLAASGASLHEADLEACYAQAWQGLYSVLLDGQEIANPAGWLAVATFRRAIEEQRARRHLRTPAPSPGAADGWIAEDVPASVDLDLAAALDDHIRLRQLLLGLRGRLGAREREAAALCYLQGLSRAQAAARMGLSESRMRKLMEGHAPGRPGVSGKVAALVETIRAGAFCEEQSSLMRALAFGMLDPEGERHRVASLHRSECPACRAYVLSLRGLAAALPPVLSPWTLGSSLGAAAGQTGAALPASGASAAGAGGGGWLLTGGGLGAKLAAGCLLVLGVGAGCVVIVGGHGARPPGPGPGGHSARPALARAGTTRALGPLAAPPPSARGSETFASTAAARAATGAPAAAGREFGLEQPAGPIAPGSPPSGRSSTVGSASSSPPSQPGGPSAVTRASGSGAARAEREFSPG